MIDSKVNGDKALRDWFAKTPEKLRQELRKEIDRLAIMLQARMKGKLSGQVLKVKTGRLRRSINVQKGSQTGVGYTATVGTNVAYAAAHEYGFQGTVSVPAHMRTVRKAFGRPVKSPTQHLVRQHARRLRLPERSFARSSYDEMQGQMTQQLATFISNAIKKGS